jgi:hypothetical protein
MNPGLLNTPLALQSRGETRDELGQPIHTWETIATLLVRRMPGKPQQDTPTGDRETDRRQQTFTLRSQPFLTLYRPGISRLLEHPRPGFPPTIWNIDGWAELEGTKGMFISLTASTPAERPE